MTNKEKYPNAEVRNLDDEYYVSLDGISHYLVGGKPNKDCTKGWFKTQKEAQTALDNFMNGPKTDMSESEKLCKMLKDHLSIRVSEKRDYGGKGIEVKILFDNVEITSDYVFLQTWQN
jgi:hypothetical protein